MCHTFIVKNRCFFFFNQVFIRYIQVYSSLYLIGPILDELKSVPSVCVCLQEMTRAARRTGRRTPTGTSGSRSHAGSASVTTARSSATRSSALSWVTARRCTSPTASAAPFVRWIHPAAAAAAAEEVEEAELSVSWRPPSVNVSRGEALGKRAQLPLCPAPSSAWLLLLCDASRRRSRGNQRKLM